MYMSCRQAPEGTVCRWWREKVFVSCDIFTDPTAGANKLYQMFVRMNDNTAKRLTDICF